MGWYGAELTDAIVPSLGRRHQGENISMYFLVSIEFGIIQNLRKLFQFVAYVEYAAHV